MLAALVASAGVFGYDKYLESVRTAKEEKLKQAEASISRDTVEEFIRLRNRFESTETLLSQHVGLSQFFDLLESMSVQRVQFDHLSIEVEDDRTATIEVTGTAANFNALAAESAAFAAEKRIRRAIFSGISTNQTGAATFTLEAELDPRIVIWTGPTDAAPAPAAPAAPASTSTEPTL